MKSSKLLCAMAAIYGLTAAAYAEPTNYIEAGYGLVHLQDTGASATPGVAIVRYGFQMNPNFAIEADGVATARSATLYAFNGLYEQAVDVSVSGGGVFLKGSVDPAPGVQLFAKVGVVDARVTVAADGAWATERSTSASYGVGAHINVGTSAYLQLDYVSYYDKDGVQARGPALSIGYKF